MFLRNRQRQIQVLRSFSTVTSRMSSITNPKIALDENETKIRSLLIGFCDYYRNKTNQQLTLRITGGWVRDKLLGKTSHDIDIAIDSLTGKQFGEALKGYIEENTQRLGVKANDIHIVAANPEKSKHLETAITTLYGLDIDFVNLRSEEYTHESRVPEIEFGTPQQDAFRRDATLNSLFYNLQEEKVEDFTGTGLQDLSDGVLRTPLKSFETFHDDPLRVLRLLRFASTFGFRVAPEALEAMKDERIRQSLAVKISRERVGVEVRKMLCGAYPQIGLGFVADLGLEDSIFHLLDGYRTKQIQDQGPPASTLKQGVVALQDMKQKLTDSNLAKVFTDQFMAPVIWSMASLCRWGTTVSADPKGAQVVQIIIRDGVKWPKIEARLAEKLTTVESAVAEAAANLGSKTRQELGVLVRDCGQYWSLALVYSMLNRHLYHSQPVDELVQAYTNLSEQIEAQGLSEAWNMRAAVNGGELIKAFAVKSGPWMSKANERCILYQLANPEAGKQACLEYLVSIKDELL